MVIIMNNDNNNNVMCIININDNMCNNINV